MQPDPIVEEVRAAREAYARRFDFDLRAICRDLRDQERRSDRERVSLPPRRPVLDRAAEALMERGARPDAADAHRLVADSPEWNVISPVIVSAPAGPAIASPTPRSAS